MFGKRACVNWLGDITIAAVRKGTPLRRSISAGGDGNDRDVARSLRELWDKIPGSYRMTVIQYFKDISDPESPKEDK